MKHDGNVTIGTATRGLELAASITLSLDDRRRHLHLLGKTGTGKTTLLRTLLFDDLRNGRGFALLDPLGGLAQSIVDAVQKSRNDSTVYFDPSDLEHPIGFNPLHRVPSDQRHLVADHVVAAFAHIWGANLEDTPRLIYLLYNSVRLLLDTPGSTLLGLPRLLVDDRYRERLVQVCEDPVVAAFWVNEFGSYDDRFKVQVISPAQNKIGMLLAGPLANILGQRRSTVDIERLMNEGGHLVANLAKGKVGRHRQSSARGLTRDNDLTGCGRAQQPAEVAWPDFTLYCDEVQNCATERFAGTLSEGRNGKLLLVLAHQYLEQLPNTLRHAIVANCGSFIVFRIGSLDAKVMAGELGLENVQTLSDTRNFSAWVKLLKEGNPTDPFVVDTVIPEAPAKDRMKAVIAHTRARHTRSRQSVEISIHQQLHN